MFKKLKDKLAEEVKSSPQRIQQFAQAAQAAVTSASSSISDITNNDLFSITDNDNPQNNTGRSQSSPIKQQATFQDVSLTHSPQELANYSHEMDTPRQRKLSNSSFASDISFRLPSYETPSTYHLQSDMEVSASEADDRGFSGGPATLDRVTKEQLYSAYKRTQERYTKYRNQYGDLARHYKLLERENAKARSVLVETQDKALRRISELKEQCTLEQSAKAHLEKALRIEIEEKAMKIEALNTKVNLLQNIDNPNNVETKDNDNDVQLITLASDSIPKPASEEPPLPDITSLNNKIEKMDQLLNKYKESLKMSKDKNSQMTVELQILSNEIDTKNKQIQEFKIIEAQLNEANTKIKQLNDVNEELQNQINAYDFTKIKELSTLEMDLQKATEEIIELRSKIDVFSKREEDYAISLAENKLSIHKELESKEAEIKSLKDSLAASKQENQSMKIVLGDYKNSLLVLEGEKEELNKDSTELATTKVRIDELNLQLQELSKKCQSLEQLKTKADEEYKCLQLQHKQETAEKLAMIDRNVYLEGRNTQLSEENVKRSSQITSLENELQILSKNITDASAKDECEATNLLKELNMWKEKCETLESEIQEEREELVKLQTEIEKLLVNHESIQSQNVKYRTTISNLTADNLKIQEHKAKISRIIKKTSHEVSELRNLISLTSKEMQTFITTNKKSLCSFATEVIDLIKNVVQTLENKIDITTSQCRKLTNDYEDIKGKLEESYTRNSETLADKIALEAKINKLSDELDTEGFALKDELLDKKNAYEQALQEIKAAKIENEALHKRVQEVEIEKRTTENLLRDLESDKKELTVIVSNLEENLAKINIDFETATRKNDESKDFVKSLIKEIEELKKNEIMELEVTKQIKCHLETEKTQHSATIESLRQMTIDKDELTEKFQNAEIKNTELIVQLNERNQLYQTTTEKMIELEETVRKDEIEINNLKRLVNEKNTVIDDIKVVENNYLKCLGELEDLNARYKVAEKDIHKLNSDLNHKSEDCERKCYQINEMEEKCAVLSEENIKLKCEAANFISDINKLESEINEIKKSHTEMEHEKDLLNIIIEKLERKETDQITQTKDTQTDTPIDVVSNINENSALFENKWVLENKLTAMTNTASLNLKTNVQEDIIEQYTALKINNDTLKDDNRRLQSDIEGLQSYLTKISKENSVLNDKLREVIATSEHSMDNDQLSCDINQLNNELQSGKEKINDLLRENSILIEENLELKDQLNSQNYSKPLEIVKSVNNNSKETENIKEKYDDLLQNTSEIKKQNIDLEQINKSVTNNNKQLQEKNEKLKLSNEKLERRLDEALVSLRHLHSLSENTELEYLRNILYEYLTGTGTHSLTLAKVLAAIVKFDDMQTQMVLQKEKERQGFLRQLGII